jgi:transposase-like protein
MARKLFRTPARRRAVQRRFLNLLRTRGVTARQAARTIGARIQTLYVWRQKQPAFAAAWQSATLAGDLLRLEQALDRPLDAHSPDGGKLPLRGGRNADLPEARHCVLALLREGATAWYAARRTGLGKITVAQWRRRDPAFDAEWRAAYKAGSLALLNAAARRHAARLKQGCRA